MDIEAGIADNQAEGLEYDSEQDTV